MKLRRFGVLIVLALMSLVAPAQAADSGCTLRSELRACTGEPGLVRVGDALGSGLVYIASRPSDHAIVALVADGNRYHEVGLYWPTPRDPTYKFRRMKRLPSDTTLVGNAADQTIIVLREATELVVDGELLTYQPLDYNGFTLTVDGCGGDDELEGGDGNDHLFDYAGQNQFRGHAGRDWLEGTGTLFSGGAGDDCITADGDGHLAQILGDDGDDTLESTGRFGVALGGAGSDTCSAGTVDECEDLAPAMCLAWN